MSELEGNFLPDTVTNTIIEYDTLFIEKVIIEHDSVFVYITDTLVITDTVYIVDTVTNTVIDTVYKYHTDTVYVTRIDTVIVNHTDTVYEEVRDTIVITKELVFDCYDFDSEGRLVVTSSEDKKYLISYNLQMETSGDVYFKQETSEKFVLEDNQAYFSGNTAYFDVSKGTEKQTLAVNVRGASYIIFNNQDVTPCYNFYVEAELSHLQDREVNDVIYEVAIVNYYFYNAEGNMVETASQLLFAPKYEENERNVTIDYTIESAQTHTGYELVINGKIDNSIYSDTITQARIPLFLSIETEAKKSVRGTNFNFNYVDGVVEVSTNTSQAGITKEFDAMKVRYNEYEALYNHLVSASSNQITNQQKVRYINDFTVEIGGETESIKLPLKVSVLKETIDPVGVVGGLPTQNVTISYQASLDILTASAPQEIEISVDAVYFEGEEITFANKSVAFKTVLAQAIRFTCVLSKSSAGEYYYRYRQDGETAWTTIAIDEKEHNWLLTNAQRTPSSAYGLANYNSGGGVWKPGFIECKNFKDQAWFFNYNEKADNDDPVYHNKFGIGYKELETMVNQNYDQPVWHATNVQGDLYLLDGVYFLFK